MIAIAVLVLATCVRTIESRVITKKALSVTQTISLEDFDIMIVPHKKSWPDAQAYCVMQGGKLAQPSTKERNDIYENVLRGANVKGEYWIGLNDRKEDYKLRWTDGTLLLGFVDDWYHGTLSNNNDRFNCGVVKSLAGLGDYKWAFSSCEKQKKFLCEITGPILCGTRPLAPDHLVGKSDAALESWPWQVNIEKEGNHSCSGAIVNEHWILTSAQCVFDPDGYQPRVDSFIVKMGISTISGTPAAQESPVSYIEVHPLNDPPSREWDFALMYFDSPLTFTEYIRPVCLPPPPPESESSDECAITGWELVSNNGTKYYNHLQQVILHKTDNCSNTESSMCIVEHDDGSNKTVYAGDSGSSLVCLTGVYQWYLTGLLEWEESSANHLNYSPVAMIIDWVNNTIHEERIACGTTPANDRIVGGSDATLGNWPWDVVLYVEDSHNCSGIIIDEHWVMSSAKCMYNYESDPPVLADVSQFEFSAPLQLHVSGVDSIHLHPEYISTDLALLHTPSTLPFNDYVRPVCMATTENKDFFPEGKTCFITGWGKLGDNQEYATNLQEAEMVIINKAICRFVFSMFNLLIPDNRLCVSYQGNVTGPCLLTFLDTGSSLVCQKDDGRWYLAGIISFFIGKCGSLIPAVYTSVTSELSWIMDTIRNDK
ncbi:transmembrane protease serine 9-like [Saccoglossus kowalevskii]|uniref:Transmembrane protease serine 9-like n=1 Tax=Saccoglossus kowalevskii TaxID=10224 RepID=A0ABM0M4D6_SACKO|nr:PREDICTED: transmembrane protease serine 9-like [Saccoglossus kowalevskii]